MTRITAFAMLSVALLAGCSATTRDKITDVPYQPAMKPHLSDSIGFTGLSREPY